MCAKTCIKNFLFIVFGRIFVNYLEKLLQRFTVTKPEPCVDFHLGTIIASKTYNINKLVAYFIYIENFRKMRKRHLVPKIKKLDQAEPTALYI